MSINEYDGETFNLVFARIQLGMSHLDVNWECNGIYIIGYEIRV